VYRRIFVAAPPKWLSSVQRQLKAMQRRSLAVPRPAQMQGMTEIDGYCVRHVGPAEWAWCMQSNGPGASGMRRRPAAAAGGTVSAGCGRLRAPLSLSYSMQAVRSSRSTQSWLPPRLRCLPGKSTSGCTTRMWRVNASLREKVFSSTQRAQRTFCLRALWIVSS
jgi:hypothetical protein